MKIDKESSDLLVFNTPFGRYKFLRFPFGIHSASEIFQSELLQFIESINGTANVQDDIIILGNFVRKCVNPIIYLKFLKQACIPVLLSGAYIWSLTSTHLEKLERCQRWFIKRLFNLQDYTSNEILAIVSGIPSVVTIINQSHIFLADLSHCRKYLML